MTTPELPFFSPMDNAADALADVMERQHERRDRQARQLKLDIIEHLRHPDPAAVEWVVGNRVSVRDASQVLRILDAYASALEQRLLPAVKP